MSEKTAVKAKAKKGKAKGSQPKPGKAEKKQPIVVVSPIARRRDET